MVTFQAIRLEANHGDDAAVLVLRADRLVAVASQLGAQHGTAAGQWYVEAVFDDSLRLAGRCCASLDELATLLVAA